MAKKKSIRVDFVKSCITYSKLNKIAISGIENICKRLRLDSIYDVINGRFAILSRRPSGKKSSSKRVAKCDTVFVTYRFCGHPTEEQASDLNQNIGASRFMWNRMLADYKLMWKLYGISIPMTPADYKDVSGLEWLNDRDSLALANVQLNLEKARSDYFAGERGAPKRKKKHQCKDSYTTNRVGKNIRIEDGGLRLPKINGLIELSMHRPIKPDGTLKSVTVTHEPDGKWYFSILIEYTAEEVELSDGLQKFFASGDINAISGIGLDMSVPFLYIDSSGNKPSYELNGREIKFVKQYRKLEKRIAKEQRRRSHMVKDSNNYSKQSEKIARLYAKAKHRREDFLHQIAVRLVKCIKDNIGDISKEPKEIQMAAKMHSFMEDYDKAYRDINDYLEGKTTKLNEGKNMNQYAVTRAFENVIIRHDGDLVITDKHVEIGKNYDIPRTNSFPENDYQLTDALREVRERVADSLAKDFSDDKETQEQFKEMYSSLHGSWSVRQGDPHERDSLDDRYSAFSDDEMKEANKAAADAFLKVIKCENVQKLLADIKEGDIKHNLDVMMHSPDCNFYDLINAYEMSGAREQIGNMVTEACKNADDPTNVRPEEVGLTADEIRGITKIEEIINAEEELASTFDVMNDYMEGDISIEEVKEIFDNECQPEFIANAFADMLNENSRYCVNTAYDDVEQKLKNIYKECDFDSPEFKEAFDNVSFYHLSDFVQIRNESRADNEFQKWMSDPERKSVADLREAIYDSADHRADRDNVTSLIGQAIKHAPAEMISDKQTTQKFADVTAEYSIPLSKISSFDEVKENNPEIANKFEESYKDNLKESLAEEIAVNAKWDVPYVFDDIRRDIENLYHEINENDKADIIVSAANILENKRLTGEADMSKKDVSLSLANACVAIGFTEDRSVDAIDKAVEKNPQVKDITDDMMKTAVFKDMVMDYVEDFKGFISDIENTIDQLDKSTVEKVIDDVSGRMINAYGDKKERLEEVQKAADEYVKGDKMDLNQDEISYDDDDDHDDH